MNALLAIARKDALLLWRDKAALFWILGLPLLFATFFGTIFSGGGGGGGSRGSLTLQVVDLEDHEGSKAFVQRLAANSAVKLIPAESPEAAETAVRKGKATAYIRIERMAEDGVGMFSGESPRLVVGIDPSRQAEAGMLQGVVMEAVFGGMQEMFTDLDKGKELAAKSREQLLADEDAPMATKLVLGTFLGSLEKFFDELPQTGSGGGEDGTNNGPMNPDVSFLDVTRETNGPKFSSYDISFPQSIAWALISVAFGFALSLVRERSDGTMLRLTTAPISRSTLLGGKWLACAGMAVTVVIFLFGVGKLVFGIQIVDPLALLVAILSAATAFAGLMMLLGTLGKTEAAASGAAWGVMMPLAMLGGGMVPQIAMPSWMLTAGMVSPIRWSIEAFEGASWRGYSWGELLVPCGVLVGMGLVCLWLGQMRLRRAMG